MSDCKNCERERERCRLERINIKNKFAELDNKLEANRQQILEERVGITSLNERVSELTKKEEVERKNAETFREALNLEKEQREEESEKWSLKEDELMKECLEKKLLLEKQKTITNVLFLLIISFGILCSINILIKKIMDKKTDKKKE